MSLLPNIAASVCVLGFAPLTEQVYAAANDPAAIQIERLHTALLKSMQAGPRVALTDRYRNLQPVIEQVFDLPLMTRLSIGPLWAKFSQEQQQVSLAAFRRITIAGYAVNFREFDGEKFEIEDIVASRGVYKVVQAHLVSPHDIPASFTYQMHEAGGVWKIVDVYYDGASELAIRRSDFAAALASGGTPVLIAHLNRLGDSLMRT
jgi:phospholipid transport system substrate-binding protein